MATKSPMTTTLRTRIEKLRDNYREYETPGGVLEGVANDLTKLLDAALAEPVEGVRCFKSCVTDGISVFTAKRRTFFNVIGKKIKECSDDLSWFTEGRSDYPEITPAAALDLLKDWPEGRAALEKLLAEPEPVKQSRPAEVELPPCPKARELVEESFKVLQFCATVAESKAESDASKLGRISVQAQHQADRNRRYLETHLSPPAAPEPEKLPDLPPPAKVLRTECRYCGCTLKAGCCHCPFCTESSETVQYKGNADMFATPPPADGTQAVRFTFAEFAAANRARCESQDGFNHKLDSWSLSDWFTAVTGELGEAANIAKKLNRIRDGVPGNAKGETAEVLRSKLADEVADAFIYLDLLMQSQGIDLAAAVVDKFNRTSRKIGYPESIKRAN